MHRVAKVVAICLGAAVAVAVLTLLLFRQRDEQARIGCAMNPDCATTTTTNAEVARTIANQTAYYQRAGLTRTEAACLADVTGRLRAPKGAEYVVGTSEQSEAIDRCNIDRTRLNRVGNYIDRHPPGEE
jgi:hypothetical protein